MKLKEKQIQKGQVMILPSRKGKSYEPTEHDEQVAFFDWVKWNTSTYPFFERLLFAIPSQRKWTYALYNYFKAEGFKDGVSDIIGLFGRRGYHGICIEMKRKGKEPSETQIDFLRDARNEGFYVCICYTGQEAVNRMLWYVTGE